MNVSAFKRDKGVVRKALKKQKDGSLVATVPLRIMFPKHYLDGKLGTIDEYFNVVGLFGVLVGDKYAACNALAYMPLSPDGTNVVTVDEVPYMELSWEAGSIVTPNYNLIKSDQLVYQVFDEIIAKGRTPWYLNIVDLATIFKSAEKHAGVNLGADNAILSILAASRARVKGDRTKYFRTILKTQGDLLKLEPDVIPQRSVEFGPTNTTARLFGAYFDRGVNSALVNPAERSETIEELLRN